MAGIVDFLTIVLFVRKTPENVTETAILFNTHQNIMSKYGFLAVTGLRLKFTDSERRIRK